MKPIILHLPILLLILFFQSTTASNNDTITISSYIELGSRLSSHYPDSALNILEKAIKLCEINIEKTPKNTSFLKHKAQALHNMGNVYNNMGLLSTALEHYTQSYNIREEIGDKTGMAYSLNNIGLVYDEQGNVSKAIEYYKLSLEMLTELGDKRGISTSLNNIGNIYYHQGDIPNALDYFNESLKIDEEIGNKRGIAYSLGNMGLLYFNQNDFEKSLEYYNKNLELLKEIDDKRGLSYSMLGIGNVFYELKKTEEALKKYNESLEILEEINDPLGISFALVCIGSTYLDSASKEENKAVKQSLIDKAMEYFKRSLKIQEELGNLYGVSASLINIGTAEVLKNEYSKALNTALRAYNISKQIEYVEYIGESAKLLDQVYSKLGNYKLSRKYFEEYIKMRDSITKEENHRLAQQRFFQYQYEKKAATDSIAHSKQIEIKNLELARSEKEKSMQRIIIYIFVVGFLVILVLLLNILRLFNHKKKANMLLALQNEEILQKNEEITAQRDEIEAQKDQIEAQHDLVVEQKDFIEKQKIRIEDSIRYAQRIQNAVLPTNECISALFDDYFILFQPKDVVSGDFYWATTLDNWVLIVAADCTGHGVPGAFMSMLGICFLNQIAVKNEFSNAADILMELREYVITALKQSQDQESQEDGMDISLAAINKKTHECHWAGANNPLWLIRKENLGKEADENSDIVEEIKADKMPVGIFIKMKKFTNHEVQLQKGDKLYLFSDGYTDQFGGPEQKKFNKKEFRKLLSNTSDLPMKEQKEILEKAISDWKNPEDGLVFDQIDDVVVLGVTI